MTLLLTLSRILETGNYCRTSQIAYLNATKSLLRDYGYENTSLDAFVNNYASIWGKLSSSNKSLSTKMMVLLALMKLFPTNLKIRNFLGIEYSYHKNEREAIQMQCNGVVSTKELTTLKMFDYWNRKNSPIDMKKLNQLDLLYNMLMYIDYVPRLEYRTLVWNPDLPTDSNYISGDGILVIQNYKTVKRYGIRKIKLSEKIFDYIKLFIFTNTIIEGEFIFMTRNGTQYGSPQFSAFTVRAFKHRSPFSIRINLWRKIVQHYTFHENEKTQQLSFFEKDKYVQTVFGHNLKTAQRYYKI